MQQPPEIVTRVREVRARGGRDAAGIDPDEDDAEIRPENVGDVAGCQSKLFVMKALFGSSS
jgi:hypothetical protein